MKHVFSLLFLLLCSLTGKAQNGEYVGGDISILPLYEQHNSGYLDSKGNKINDLISWFVSECGWNSFRVRLFVDPKEKDAKGNVDHAVCQNLEYVMALGKRIKDAGAKLVLDIQYSDTWADPSYQLLPYAWADCTTTQKKADKVYEYTKDVLETLSNAGAKPDFVQVGNEITYGMIGIKAVPYEDSDNDWDGMTAVLSKGCRAVRETCPEAKIIIHTERAGDASLTNYYYTKLKQASLDYDIIGLSYYPFYQGDMASLSATLSSLATAFPDKKVQIMETAYPFENYPGDKVYDLSSTWAASADGQYAFASALLEELKKHANVNGLYWWQPEEAGNGDDTDWGAGTGATVMNSWKSRGMWWCKQTATGHWPVKASEGFVGKLLSSFLGTTPVENVPLLSHPEKRNTWYSLSGIHMSKPSAKGVYINSGKKLSVK